MHLLCILHRSSITTCCQKPVFSWGGGAASGFVQPSIPSSGRDIIDIICLAYLMTEWLDFQSYNEQKNKLNEILPFIFWTAKIPKLNSAINLWRLCLQNKSNSLTKAVTVLTLPSITRWIVVVWIMKTYWQSFLHNKKQIILFGFLIKNKYSVLNVLFNFSPLYRTWKSSLAWSDVTVLGSLKPLPSISVRSHNILACFT